MPHTAELITELQSLGLRLQAELAGRRGGAGPAEGGALLIDGRAINVPTASPFVARSPFLLRRSEGRVVLLRHDRPLREVELLPLPRFYSRRTAQGTPYHHLALRHGRDCLATTVLQRCRYWDTPARCRFCGIELSLAAGVTTEQKSPRELAQVAAAAQELDGIRHVVLTTGTAVHRSQELDHLAACAQAIKAATGLPVHAQLMPPPHPAEDLARLHQAGVDTVGIHIESWDPATLARVAPAKAALGRARFEDAWRRAVEIFGPNQVSSFLLAGLGEPEDSLRDAFRHLADLGVYPFLVPLRPIPGSQMAEATPPPPAAMMRLYQDLALVLQSRGLSASRCRAGCVRCGACSAIAAWELPLPRTVCHPARTADELQAALDIRRQVFVEEQGIVSGSDQDEIDPRSIHLVAVEDGEVVGTVRIFTRQDEPDHWMGGRLAVKKGRRGSGLGALLVRTAVRTAAERGCRRFTAYIQEANVPFFQRLGWRVIGPPLLLHDWVHLPMQADLARVGYPPYQPSEAQAETRWQANPRSQSWSRDCAPTRD